jgi:hypothetical protein
MTEFMIEGDINIAASRVLVPVAVATILPNVVMPVSGTVTTTSAGGTITIGTIAAVGTILSPLALGTVLSPVPIAGTISVGTVTAVVDIGTVNVVGTLDALLGTINANVSGTVSVGSILSPLSIGTVLSPVPTTILSGTISFLPANYVFTNVSAVIKGTPGTLWQINAAGESGLVAGAGTLLVLDAAATVLVMPLAAGGFQSAPFGPNGVNFGSLIASVIGNVDATFVIH